MNSRPEFYVGVMKLKDASFCWINAKGSKNIVSSIIGSCELLVLSNKPRFIADGNILVINPGAALPVKELINYFGITDLIIVHNREIDQRKLELGYFSRKFCEYKLKKFSPEIKQVFFSSESKFNASMDWLCSEECDNLANVGIICPAVDKLSRTTKNLTLLKQSARNAAIQTIEIFQPNWSQEKIHNLVCKAIP